jgi:hypothetical protein
MVKRKAKKKTSITLNKEPVQSLQKIIVNFTGLTRHDTLDGRDYLVAPMVMIVEGVLNGTNGPLLYPADELSKTPAVWNMKPVVVYHPSKNGKGVSACDADIIKNRGVGIIMNAVFEDSKLKAEAWIDINKAAKVDDRIIEAIEKNEVMELSTGLFTDNERAEGEFDGKPYTGIARNLRPDHLALLPDQTGACSIEDGAGFLRLNVSNAGTSVEIDLKETPINLEGMSWLAKNAQLVTHKLAELIVNEISHSDIWSLLSSLLREGNEDLWIDEVFDSFFIYIDGGVLYKQNYSINDGEATLIGTRSKVIRSIVLKTEDGTVINNEINVNQERDHEMDKPTLVAAIIANASTQFTEADKEALMAMDEEVLNKMLPVEDENAVAVANAAKEAHDKALSLNQETVETPDKPQTAQEYIDSAPGDVKAMLQNGMNSYAADKAKLIKIITANKKNTFTDEQLQAKQIEELKSLAELAANTKEQVAEVKTLDFSGQADVEANVENADTPLPLPTLGLAPTEKTAAVA